MNTSHRFFEHGSAARGGRSVLRIVGWTIGGIALAVLFAFVFGFVVKLLWNALMPAVFGLATITFWQAFGLVLLAKILFGGHGHGPGRREHGFPLKKPFEKKDPGEGAEWRRFREFWNTEGKKAYEDFCQKSGGARSGE